MMASSRLGGDAGRSGRPWAFAGRCATWTCRGWQPLVEFARSVRTTASAQESAGRGWSCHGSLSYSVLAAGMVRGFPARRWR